MNLKLIIGVVMFLLCFAFVAHAQETTVPATTQEEMPEFPGGPLKMFEHLQKNKKYRTGTERRVGVGTVEVSFIVDKEGKVQDPTVKRSLSPFYDKEAIRLISIMPQWEPGKINGEPVPVRYNVPIKF